MAGHDHTDEAGAHPMPHTLKDVRLSRPSIRSVVVALLAALASAGAPARAATTTKLGPWAFSCDLTEPFWSVAVSKAGVAIDLSDEPADHARVRSVSGSPSKTLRIAVVRRTGLPLSITIDNTPGGDGMSDRVYSHTLTVSGPDTRNVGGCQRVGDGATPLRVRDVAAQDTLNVRATPSSSGAVRARLENGQQLWRRTGRATGAWWPVEVVVGGERDRLRVIQGWAHSRYLAPL